MYNYFYFMYLFILLILIYFFIIIVAHFEPARTGAYNQDLFNNVLLNFSIVKYLKIHYTLITQDHKYKYNLIYIIL